MGTLLKRMHGHVHEIANFSAIKSSIQKQNKLNSFEVNEAEMMSVKFEI